MEVITRPAEGPGLPQTVCPRGRRPNLIPPFGRFVEVWRESGTTVASGVAHTMGIHSSSL